MYIVSECDSRRELLPVYLTTAGYQFSQPPVNRKNGAPFHHIFYVERGEGVFEVGGRRYVLGVGTAIFIHRELPIRYHANGGEFLTAWVTFDGPFAAQILEYFRAGEFVHYKNERLYPMILQCCRLSEQGAPPDILSKNAYELIVSFFHQREELLAPASLRSAKAFIEKRYAQDLSVHDMAAAAGISESMLSRLFRRYDGVTPVEFLRRVRLRHARLLLLQNPELPVAGVGAQCGFGDSAYFCKVFREQTGMPPQAFRRLHGG